VTAPATVRLGYQLGSGEPVDIPLRHLVVTGLTQHAGKTTTLEALLTRAGVPAIAFKVKRGELDFLGAVPHAPYFRERADWQYVEAILEAALRERLRFERSWIMRACKGATTLRQVHDQVRHLLKSAKGIHESVYTTLDHYLALVVPQIQATRWASQLDVGRDIDRRKGFAVMDLTTLSAEMQALVIRSTIDTVMDVHHGAIVVLPEAWAFLPQTRGGPVKAAADRLLHEGAVLGNYGWLDSQDLAGLDKRYLKHVGVWLLGCQPEANEAEHTLRQIPLPKRDKPAAADIQGLGRGEFYACWQQDTGGAVAVKVYVQPAWLDERTARAVAMGTEGKGTAYVERKPIPGARPRSAARLETEDPAMCQEHAKLAAEVTEYQRKLADALSTVYQAGQRAGKQEQEIRRLSDALTTSTRFAEALKAFIGGIGDVAFPTASAVDVDQVVEKVLARIPSTAAGGAVLQVTPPEKLRHDFQAAEVTRVLEAVAALSPLARTQLRLLEAIPHGTAIGQQTLAERLGRSWGGNARVTFVTALKELEALGVVEIQERVGVRSTLRAKLEADLGFYSATVGDIDATYQHVLARLAEPAA